MDNVEEQFDAFNEVDWDSFPGPTYEHEGRVVEMYDPRKVPRALRTLTEATSEELAWNAHDHFLFSIGNDHRGTLYPAAAAAMPFVVDIARRTDCVWASFAALNVLIDIVASFEPENGYDVFVRPDGTAVGLMDAVVEPVRRAEDHFRPLLANASFPKQLRDGLGELLDLLGQLGAEDDSGVLRPWRSS